MFVQAGWQLNVNGAGLLPYDMEVAANLFGRQGNPFPIFRQASLGLDGQASISSRLGQTVSPDVDTFRFDDLWNLDVRWSKRVRLDRFELQLVADLFNVFDANTVLNRQRNVESANFQRITQNLSPRILRFGLRMGF